jgi:2-phosphoglycerate kinase
VITKHFIYGVPGVGKTTIASDFAERHNYLYLELDFLRQKAQELVLREQEPFIYEYSTEAWKKFGELNKENAVNGFLAVRQAFRKYITEELSLHGVGYVAEAVYIDPATVQDSESIVTLLVTNDEDQHYSHFFLHREHSEEENTQFRAARYIQEYLLEEATNLGVKVVENNQTDSTILSGVEL